jgi:hypothetical protein
MIRTYQVPGYSYHLQTGVHGPEVHYSYEHTGNRTSMCTYCTVCNNSYTRTVQYSYSYSHVGLVRVVVVRKLEIGSVDRVGVFYIFMSEGLFTFSTIASANFSASAFVFTSVQLTPPSLKLQLSCCILYL